MLTQLSRSGQVLKLRIDDVRMQVTTRFHIQGSILKGTLASRPLEFDATIELDSQESRKELVRLLRVAEESCYVLQSLLAPVRVKSSYIVNGEAVQA